MSQVAEETHKEAISPIQSGLYELAEKLSRLEGVFDELQIQLEPVLSPEGAPKEDAPCGKAVAASLCLVAESLEGYSGRVQVITNKIVELSSRAQV